MSAEGSIRVRLDGAGTVELVSERPLAAASTLFAGRDPEFVLATLPRVFSVCGNAQGVAATRAVAMALAAPGDAATEIARDILVLAETAREHLWRLLLDWPQAHGDQPDGAVAGVGGLPAAFRAALFGDGDPFAVDAQAAIDGDALNAAVGELRALLAEHVCGDSPAAWLRGAANGMHDWIAGTDTAPARFLRWLDEAGMAAVGAAAPVRILGELDEGRLGVALDGADADAFVARPQWDGGCRETGPYARSADRPALKALAARHGHGLLPRSAARVLELAAIPSRMLDLHQRLDAVRGRTMDRRPGPAGLSQVEAARGRLAHFVRIEDGRIADYRILAPTEWNFHPSGLAAAGLAALEGADPGILRQQAELWLGAVDPCVEYRLEIG